jgi:hypothetical protein
MLSGVAEFLDPGREHGGVSEVLQILEIQGATAARLGALFDLEYVSHSTRENRGADTGDVEFRRQR